MAERPAGGGDRWVLVAGVAALAICCGGPLLVVALVVSGFGAWLIAQGTLLIGALALIAGVAVAALWLRRAARHATLLGRVDVADQER